MCNPKLPDLYAILDFRTCLERNLDPRALAKSWFDAGVQLIQIRSKNLSDLNYWVFAEAIREVSLPYDATLLINARPDIAKGLELDGVHLPVSGFPIDTIRKVYPEMLVFASCHNLEEIESRKSADAITLSPLLRPHSKSNDSRTPLGLTAFKEMANTFHGKTYALGGIDEKSLTDFREISVASLGFLCQPNAYENARCLVSRGSS